MVFLATTFTPLLSERFGEKALLFIPLSALLGIFLGWQLMMLLFSLV